MSPHPRFALLAAVGALALALSAPAQADPQVLGQARALLAGGNAKQAYELLAPLQDKLVGQPEYDYLLGVADARFLAAMADRVIFVAQWNKTPVRAARAAVEVLQEGGANVVGAVLSQVDVKKQALYGYSDSSDYFHYYRDYYLPPQAERSDADGTPILARLQPRSSTRRLGKS